MEEMVDGPTPDELVSWRPFLFAFRAILQSRIDFSRKKKNMNMKQKEGEQINELPV